MEQTIERSWLTGKYLIHLLESVLKGSRPQEKPEEVFFGELFQLAQFHSVANIAWYGIEQLKVMPEDPLSAQWRDLRDRQVVKSFIQQAEYEAIITKLTQHEIHVLPVKGSQLRLMYPQADFRTMADLDILASEDRMEDVKRLLQEMGYSVELFDRGNQDVYYKPPVMNIEMHRSLMPERVSYAGYYANEIVWGRSIPAETNPFLHRMSWSDFYIYLTTHFHKHYSNGGSGIRSLLDVHIFLTAHQADLDEAYISAELEKIGLNEFRLQAEKVADRWFGRSDPQDDQSLSDPSETTKMEQYILGSGTYGTIDNHVQNGIAAESGSKLRYVLKRTLLPYAEMKNQYPILRKGPILLPLCWSHRLIKAVLFKRDRIQEEVALVQQSLKK